MNLTEQQRALLIRYVRDVAGRLPESLRERGARALEERITRDLDALGKPALDDADIAAVLSRIGASSAPEAPVVLAEPAAACKPLPARPPAARRERPVNTLMLDQENRVWLGVCAGLAAHLGTPPWVIRVLVLLLGFSGPIVLLAYLAMYMAMRAFSDESHRGPAIPYGRVARRGLATLCIVMVLHLGATYGLRLVVYAYETYGGARFQTKMESKDENTPNNTAKHDAATEGTPAKASRHEMPSMGAWGWIESYKGILLFWVLALAVPTAALSGLPLANAWDFSLKRLSQALVALYGVTISFGLASMLVGIILDAVKDFSGLPLP